MSYVKLGDLMRNAGRDEEAARLYGDSLDIARRLADAEPGRADYQRDLVLGLQRLGQTQRDTSLEEALGSWREAYELVVRLAEGQPNDPGIATDLAVSLFLLAGGEDDPSPLLIQARNVLEAQGDRLPENGQRLHAVLLDDKQTES